MADKEVEYFKTDVREFDEIDEQIKTIRTKIKPLTEQIKKLTTKKTELKTGICNFMAKNEIDACNLNNGKLQLKETKAVKPITKGDIYDGMSVFFTSHYTDTFKELDPAEKAKALHTFVYQENREYSDKQTLLRKN